MKKDVYIDGVNYNAEPQRCMLKGGLDKLTFQIEDQDGGGIISSAKLTFSNIKNNFDTLIYDYAKPKVEITLDNKKLFKGYVSEDGIEYKVDDRLINFEAIHSDKIFIEKAKVQKLLDISYIDLIKTELYIFNRADTTSVVPRFFFNIQTLCALIAANHGYAYDYNDGLSKYYYGGAQFNLPLSILPDISCYDFIAGVSQAFNMVWWIGANNVFTFKPKQTVLADNRLSPPLILKRLKNTLTVNGKKVGWDRITIKYPNKIDLIKTEETISRPNCEPIKTKDITLHFKSPAQGAYTYYYGARIGVDNNDNQYIIEKVAAENKGQNHKRVQVSDFTARYSVELTGTAENEVEYSLIDNYTVLPELVKPYRKLTANSGSTYFIRSAEIDPNEDKVKINAIGYAL